MIHFGARQTVMLYNLPLLCSFVFCLFFSLLCCSLFLFPSSTLSPSLFIGTTYLISSLVLRCLCPREPVEPRDEELPVVEQLLDIWPRAKCRLGLP